MNFNIYCMVVTHIFTFHTKRFGQYCISVYIQYNSSTQFSAGTDVSDSDSVVQSIVIWLCWFFP